MSGHMPPAFIVKSRTIEEVTYQTVKGPRRVQKFTKWKWVIAGASLAQAKERLEQARRGLHEYSIWHRGKKVYP